LSYQIIACFSSRPSRVGLKLTFVFILPFLAIDCFHLSRFEEPAPVTRSWP